MLIIRTDDTPASVPATQSRRRLPSVEFPRSVAHPKLFGRGGRMVRDQSGRMVETAALAALERRPQATVFTADPRTVRLTLDAGEGIPEHRHPGKSIVFHQLEGEMTVHLDGEAHDLGPGELLRFDGERSIEPRAKTESTSLIVLAAAIDQT